MIPVTITVEDAAAPHSSLAFIFWGEGLFVFPLMLVYTAVSYTVFRGKVRPASVNYHASAKRRSGLGDDDDWMH
jgi:cytochrome bd ubiquinol oxidase subunit II